jgi:hypothetical protein
MKKPGIDRAFCGLQVAVFVHVAHERGTEFICRGSDAATYFVKGADAGRRSQLCEWLAGRLAQILGLPVAPFSQVLVPEELITSESPMKLDEPGSGLNGAKLRVWPRKVSVLRLSFPRSAWECIREIPQLHCICIPTRSVGTRRSGLT